MAAKIDQKCIENGTDFVEIDIARECIDPAVGSVINNILFGYRFDKVCWFVYIGKLKIIIKYSTTNINLSQRVFNLPTIFDFLFLKGLLNDFLVLKFSKESLFVLGKNT